MKIMFLKNSNCENHRRSNSPYPLEMNMRIVNIFTKYSSCKDADVKLKLICDTTIGRCQMIHEIVNVLAIDIIYPYICIYIYIYMNLSGWLCVRRDTSLYISRLISRVVSLIAKLMGPTWGPLGADRTKAGPMLAT